ncbi:MAG: hypothetical protein KUG77_10415 [Nannocystaceae bacterium]|nr:hypothetical protein [Nannocystaceae bacterium]
MAAADTDETGGSRTVPTMGGEDELLDVLPQWDPAEGAFSGYAGSRKVRWFIASSMAAGAIAALWGGSLYSDYVREQARHGIKPQYNNPRTDISAEDRVMHWDGGTARLGLASEPPGVNLIVLPDREVRLADGYDSAQLKVRVQDGRTVKLRVLSGRIDVTRTDK